MEIAETTADVPKGSATRVSGAARNVLANWLTYLLSGAVSFFLSPFIVRHLGNSAYGIWVLLVSLTGYLGFLDLGIRGAVTRYVAKFHSEREHQESSYIVSSACGLFVAAGFLAILVSASFAVLALPHFEIPPGYLGSAQLVVVIAGLNVAVSLVSGVFGGVLVGLQRFDLNNSIAIGVMTLRTTAILIALRNGRGLIALALIQLCSTISELLLGFAVSRKLYPQARLAFSNLRRAYVSVIFSFGVYAFLMQISSYLVYYTDALVIGAFLPVSAITFFAIGSNLTLYARELVSGFSRTMTPLASKLEVEAGRMGLQDAASTAARYCSLSMLPIFTTFIIRGHTFIALWMGPSYGDLSGHVLWILSIPWLLGAAGAVSASVMLGISRHRAIVPVAVAEGLGNLVLSVLLVKRMGIIGVAWGTAIPNLAVSLFFWPWYVRKNLRISIRDYIVSLWLVPMLAMVPFGICTYIVNRLWMAKNLTVFFLQVACVLPVALMGAWYFGLTAKERQAYGQPVVSFLARATRQG